MAVSEVVIRLAVSGGAQVKGALAGAEKSLAGVQSAAADASQSLRNLAGAFAGAVTVGAFIKAADSVTILNNQLKLATGSADAAATAYASLFDIAQRSRVSFTELGGTFATISRAAESLKLSQSALLGVTEAIGNAMTISGGSAESMKAALVQLGQGLASGTLRGEELNSILEQTPRLAKALADGLGVPIGALRKLGEEGKLSAEAVITALRSQQSALAAEVAQSATTVGQAMQQLQNAVVAAVGDFDKASGSTGAMATGIQAVATTIGELRRAFSGLEDSKTDFTAFGEGVGAVMRTMTLGLTTTLTGIRQLGVGAAGLAAAGVALASGNLAGAREAMRAAGEDIDRLGSKWIVQSDAIINSAGSVARATEVNAQAVARLARQGSAAAESIKPLDFSKLVGGVDKAKKKVDEFAAALSKVTAKDVGLSADYEKTLAALYSGFVKGRIGVDAYAEAVESLIKQQPFYIAGVRDAAEAEKDRIKALDDATKSTAQYYEALQKELDALEANIEKLTRENEQIGLSKEAVVQLTLARMDEAIATEEQTLAMLTLHEAAGEEIKLIERRIALMKQERSLTASNSTKQTTADAAKDAAKEWEKTTDKINDTLTDALMRGFESGKDFAKNMRDTVVNMFKTMVLRPVIQATVQGGLSAAGFGGPGAASGVTSLAGLAAMGNYSAGASTYALRAGDWMATSSNDMLANFGTSLQTNSQAIGQFTQVAGDVLGYANALNTALSRNAQGGKDYGAAAGQALGYFFGGPMGSAIGGEIGKALGIVDYGGTMHTGGVGGYSAAGGARTGAAAGVRFGVDAKDYTASAESAATAMAKGVVGLLDSTAAKFGKDAGYYAATAFADDISPDGAWGALMVKMGDRVLLDWGDNPSAQGDERVPRVFADGADGAKQYAAEIAKDVRTLLIEQTPDWADTMLNALGDAPTIEQLANTVGQINMVQAALIGMGDASQAFASMGESVSNALIAALGGAEAAAGRLSSYYANFYTETERQDIARANITETLGAKGVALPGSRTEFRELVDQYITSGDTETAALLINNSAAYAELNPVIQQNTAAVQAYVPVVDEAAKAAEKLADKFSNARDSMAETGASLQVELLRAQGNEMGAASLERDQYLAGFADLSAAEQAHLAVMYDQNQAVRDQIKAIEKANFVSEQKTGLERRLLEVQGDTAAIRALELAALDESNRPLQERIWALEDERAETEKAAAATEKLKSAIAGMLSTAESVADKFLSGDTLKNFRLGRITDKLNQSLGQSFTAEQLGSAAIPAIQQAVIDFVQSDAAPEAKEAVIQLGASLLDLKQSSLDAAKAIEQNFLAAADAVADKFLSGDALKSFKLNRLATQINEAVGTSFDALDLDSISIDSLKQMVLAYSQNAEIAPEARIAVMQLGASLLDLKVAARDAAEALAKASTDNAYSALERAVAAQRKVIETQREAAQSLVQEVTAVFDTLKTNVADLFGEVEDARRFQAAQGRAFITAAITGAKAGAGLPDSKELGEAISAARAGLNDTVFASQAESDFQRLVLANELKTLQSLSGDQLSEAARQLKLAEDQLTSLDATLETAKSQLDALRGIDTSVISVQAAIDRLGLAMAAEKASAPAAVQTAATEAATKQPMTMAEQVAAMSAASTQSQQSLQDYLSTYRTQIAGYSDAAKSSIDVYMSAISNLQGVANVGDVKRQVEFFGSALSNVPAFDVGTNYVPRDMIAQIHEGEAIIPKAYNPAANGGEADNRNNRLESLVEGLTAEVKRLQSIVNDGNTHARRTAETLDNVTEGGSAMRTVAA